MIVGIDEVGRGPWAGPLVVGAVLLGDAQIEGLTDSKKLSKKRREELSALILGQAAAYGIGWVDAQEIDELGLSASLTLATKRALEQINVPYQQIIIDGTVNFLKDTGKGPYVTTMKKADLLISSVSAASIIAKVARDDFMALQDELYDGYDFTSHVGYGTAKHRQALEVNGVTPLHRRSFAPIALLLGDNEQPNRQPEEVSNKLRGGQAEVVAADWLRTRGYEIVDRNWQTKFCEIDIIANKEGRLYFVEVKHRKQPGQGGGVAAITPAKLRQMRFAAEMYLVRVDRRGSDASLAVISTYGEPCVVDELIQVD